MDWSVGPADLNQLTEVLLALPTWMDIAPFDARGLVRRIVSDPNLDLSGALVAQIGGSAVGFALAIGRKVPLENAPDDSLRGYITLLAVHPDHRRGGVGRALVRSCEAFHRANHREEVWVSPYAPGYLWPGPDVDAHAAGLALFKSEGYEEVYRPISMAVPLQTVQVPAFVNAARSELLGKGIAIERLAEHNFAAVLAFATEVFKGDWVRFVRETGSAILAGAATADRIQVAIDRDRKVYGFSHYEGPRFGPIGVAPEARGRKIGQVLMFETLLAQQAAGHKSAWFLWSDDATAKRLYDAAGFVEVRRFALLKKAL